MTFEQRITIIGILLVGLITWLSNRKGSLVEMMKTQEETIAHLQERLGITEKKLESLEVGRWRVVTVTDIRISGEGALIENHTQSIEAMKEG